MMVETAGAEEIVDAEEIDLDELYDLRPETWSVREAWSVLIDQIDWREEWKHVPFLMSIMVLVKFNNVIVTPLLGYDDDPPEEAASRMYEQWLQAAEIDEPIRQAMMACAIGRLCGPRSTRKRAVEMMWRKILFHLEHIAI